MEFVAVSSEKVTRVYRSFIKKGIWKSELISSFDRVLTKEEKESVIEYVKKHYGKGVIKPYPCLNNIKFGA